MKLIIIGANSQLGYTILKQLDSNTWFKKHFCRNDIQVIKIYSNQLDITDNISIFKFIDEVKPDVIINCAAYTNVDEAETEYERAFQVNAMGPRNLAISCEAVGTKLIHISTDYVFDGKGVVLDSKIVPYREYDIPNPINVYGKTKLLGENYVREFCSRYFIIRTSWLYGKHGKNFVKAIIKAAKANGKLQVVNDQVGNPTNAEDLAKHVLEISATKEYGIYHCTGNGVASWYDFARRIIEYTRIKCIIEAANSEKYNTKAKRPVYSCLDNMMLRSTIGDNMRNWEEALYDFIKNVLKI
ncbi:dTDP-4-dehydrorhamnose reductase [Inediibacterium massiliense]|uniref:dTDP-4-dehydrorhamnose reductase n=1 Tax=Inediibacterium massiliense TaxID=1658111 RepID=UPI0006B492FA|nr:dTDP-4-dehydrorhamnose reductase [Inediibacterium massiliense]